MMKTILGTQKRRRVAQYTAPQRQSPTQSGLACPRTFPEGEEEASPVRPLRKPTSRADHSPRPRAPPLRSAFSKGQHQKPPSERLAAAKSRPRSEGNADNGDYQDVDKFETQSRASAPLNRRSGKAGRPKKNWRGGGRRPGKPAGTEDAESRQGNQLGEHEGEA